MDGRKILFPGVLIGAATGLLYRLFTRASNGSAPPAPAPKNATYAAIDEYVEDQIRRFKIPGAAMLIVENNQIAHFRGFGQARPGGEPPGLHTPFFIGSVTKSITALAIMQLVEAGKVELDAPVQRYLPWFRVADRHASAQIRVSHLLNHTSGLSMLQGQEILAELDDRPGAAERQLRDLSTARLTHPVGTKFVYNNTNYNLLGLIIEAASGESYADYVQKHIFDPLGMRRSYASKSVAQRNGLAMGHRYWFGYPIPAPNLSIPLGSLASGQLISCAEDLSHYLISQLNGGRHGGVQILSSEGVEKMHQGTAEIFEMGMHLGYYALGWETSKSGNSTIISHSGIVPDFGAFAALIPAQKKGILLLYNANHAMIKLSFDEFGMGMAERLAGEIPAKTRLGWLPWLMRCMALIPVLQAAGAARTLRQVRRWRADPMSKPERGELWGRHVLLPLLPNLLLASSLIPMLSKMRGWMTLFMPDLSWIARICGGFAAFWLFLRTVLILKTPSRDH